MKKKICIVTGTRAEYGLLKNVIDLVHKDETMDLQLIATGTHLLAEFGMTYKTIEEEGYPITRKIEILDEPGTEIGVAKSIGKATSAFAEILSELEPDVVVLLGDRFEILGVAQAAMILKLPILHIHGGETTEGAIDEAIRHSLTKMSHVHCVTTAEHRKRVIQLGEQPERVFEVGAPGLDNVCNTKFLSREELSKVLDFPLKDQMFVVTYHPVTLESRPPEQLLNELFQALDQFQEASIVITLPNADPGAQVIIDKIKDYGASRDNVLISPSLGELKYLSAINQCDVVIGNSSSGLIEVPLLKKPTVNIGHRQKGRLRGSTVIDVEDNAEQITQAIKKALSPEFQSQLLDAISPYGDGQSSPRIYEVIRTMNLDNILLKRFYDIEFDL